MTTNKRVTPTGIINNNMNKDIITTILIAIGLTISHIGVLNEPLLMLGFIPLWTLIIMVYIKKY